MSKIKENKNNLLLSVILALFFLLRGILLSGKNYIGIKDLFAFEFFFSAENIAFIALLVLFSVLSAAVIGRIEKAFGEKAKYLSVLLVAEPLLFAKQENCVVLFIAVIALLFILNALREKPVVPTEITLIVFLLVSTLMSENAIFLYVLPALIFCFLGDGGNILKNTKKTVTLILSIVSVGAGIFLNDFLLAKYPAFDSFIKKYSFFEQTYVGGFNFEDAVVFVFALPSLILGIYFLTKLVKASTAENKTEAYVSIGAVAAAYVLSVIGFFVAGSDAFFTVNYVVPLMIFALMKSKSSAAQSAMDKVNALISKNTLVFVCVVVFICFAAARAFYGSTDNIAAFILSI